MALAIAVHNIPEARASPARLSGASRVSSACTAGRARRRAASGAARRRRDRLLRAQGVIVAAPVYAATGSRWKAMGIALWCCLALAPGRPGAAACLCVPVGAGRAKEKL